MVPPAQAEMIVAALRGEGPARTPTWPSRASSTASARPPNIIRALEAELWFYGKVFGFAPADAIEPVPDATGL